MTCLFLLSDVAARDEGCTVRGGLQIGLTGDIVYLQLGMAGDWAEG